MDAGLSRYGPAQGFGNNTSGFISAAKLSTVTLNTTMMDALVDCSISSSRTVGSRSTRYCIIREGAETLEKRSDLCITI